LSYYLKNHRIPPSEDCVKQKEKLILLSSATIVVEAFLVLKTIAPIICLLNIALSLEENLSE